MRDHCTLDAPPRRVGESQSAGGSTAVGRRRWFAVLKRIVLGGLLALAAPTMVLAQSETYFDRNNNVSVLGRPRPDYQALGIVVGGVVVDPSVTVSTQYNDNILASSDPIGDLITALTPTVEVNSNWSRNAVQLTATATSNFYASHPSQNTTDYQFSGAGRLDILAQSNITAGFSVGQFAVPRSSEDNFSGSLTPVVYDGYNANVGALQTLNRVQFSEGFTFVRTAYDNNVDVDGAPLLFDQLDNDVLGFSAKANYAIDPAISAFLSVTGNDRLYDDTATAGGLLDRDSSGFETTIGLDFDITRLVRGHVQFGYLDQSYVSHAFHTVTGPAFHAQVEYFPSGLDTITLHLDRSVIDAVDPTAVSYLQSQVGLQLDHELLRNLILSGRAGYETDTYTGAQRNDDRITASVRGTYFVNRHLGVTATYSFLDDDSTGVARIPSYRENVVSLSVVVQQ
jgi:hypothetical protein